MGKEGVGWGGMERDRVGWGEIERDGGDGIARE